MATSRRAFLWKDELEHFFNAEAQGRGAAHLFQPLKTPNSPLPNLNPNLNHSNLLSASLRLGVHSLFSLPLPFFVEISAD